LCYSSKFPIKQTKHGCIVSHAGGQRLHAPLRQGGNITGFAQYEQSLAAKLLELLKQIAPRVTRAAFVYDPANPNWPGYLAELQAAAPSLGMQLSGARSREVADIERTIDAFAREPDGCLIVKASPIPNLNRERLINHARRQLCRSHPQGEKPGDLPVQFATKLELVINARTAKALRLEVPLALLMRADEVIE
jgi:putative ABC transport system substrate-binding protein